MEKRNPRLSLNEIVAKLQSRSVSSKEQKLVVNTGSEYSSVHQLHIVRFKLKI